MQKFVGVLLIISQQILSNSAQRTRFINPEKRYQHEFNLKIEIFKNYDTESRPTLRLDHKTDVSVDLFLLQINEFDTGWSLD